MSKQKENNRDLVYGILARLLKRDSGEFNDSMTLADLGIGGVNYHFFAASITEERLIGYAGDTRWNLGQIIAYLDHQDNPKSSNSEVTASASTGFSLAELAARMDPKGDVILRIEAGKGLTDALEQDNAATSKRHKMVAWFVFVPMLILLGMWTVATRPWINAIAIAVGMLSVIVYRKGGQNELVRFLAKFTSPILLIPWGTVYWLSGGRLPLLVFIVGTVITCWSICTPRRDSGHVLD